MTGADLQRYRVTAGLSTADLAALSGVPQSAIVFYEFQRRIPRGPRRALDRGLWTAKRRQALATAPVPPCGHEQLFAARGHRDAGEFVAHARRCPACRLRRDHVFRAIGRPPAARWTERALASLDALPWPIAAAGQGAVGTMVAAMPAAAFVLLIAAFLSSGEGMAMAALGMAGAGAAGLVGGALYGAFRRVVPATLAGACVAAMLVAMVIGSAVYGALWVEGEIEPESAGAVRAVLATSMVLVGVGMGWVAWRLEPVRLPWVGGPAVPVWSPFWTLALTGIVSYMAGPAILGTLLTVAEARESPYETDFTTDTTISTVMPTVMLDGMEATADPVPYADAAQILALLSHVDDRAVMDRYTAGVDSLMGPEFFAGARSESWARADGAIQAETAQEAAARSREEQAAGQKYAAYDAIKQATEADPRNGAWWVDRATLAFELGRRPDAYLSLLAAQAVDPGIAATDPRVSALQARLEIGRVLATMDTVSTPAADPPID